MYNCLGLAEHFAIFVIGRRRVEFGMIDSAHTELSDEDLASFIRQFRLDYQGVGESMASGLLRSRGYRIPRARIRSALKTSDPLSSALRWPGRLTRRRVYSVAGPNSLWHIGKYNYTSCEWNFTQYYYCTDSHHKLIRWRLVTHGGIDGYSRLIVYLKCCSNIKSSTVYDSFLEAVAEYRLPSRVRSDQGGENILVAQHMIEQRGDGRNSMIVGSSVHNQRIERLWRDMHTCVTVLFYKLFYYMEQHDSLDMLDEKHLYALHYVFIPRINKSLSHFQNGWNHHPVRTAHHKSPYQLFTAGMLLLQNSQLTALDFFDATDSDYGIDEEAPVPSENGNIVQVPESTYNLSNNDYLLLQQTIDPLGPSDNYGIDIYECTVQFLDSL